MKHSISFFKDEIRNGFYIPTSIKAAWASTLDVLAEIDRICTKYNITYYADWGTLLGAVRHGGFIPWDDDLDICMKRDDYDRFREVADSELPSNYDIHDYERHENHWLFLARVVNNRQMCFEPAYLNEHYNFPWLAGVDIFIKDYLYDDPSEEEKRDKEILEILAVADGIISGTIDKKTCSEKTGQFCSRYGFHINTGSNERDTAVALYRLAELQMSRVKPDASGKLGQIFPWVIKHGASSGEPASLYEKTVRLPFEDTTIPVPASYDRILRKKYGKYNVIRKVWDGHDYPYFESQKKEMERILGKPYPAFTFDEKMLARPVADKADSLKAIASECIGGLEEYLSAIDEAVSEERWEDLEGLFGGSLELCEDLGTLTENVKGAESAPAKAFVGTLEKYCAVLTESYNGLAGSGIPIDSCRLKEALGEVRSSAASNILNRKETLFITTGPSEWKSLVPFYLEEKRREETDVSVISVSLMFRDVYGNIMQDAGGQADESGQPDADGKGRTASAPNERQFYSLDASDLRDRELYDLALHSPERIYIQNPYDGENPVLTVPAACYASELIKHTDELIYVPIGKTSEFSAEDRNDIHNLGSYVTAPGVIYSDITYVQSENIRSHYINALTSFAGEKTKAVWEEKIRTVPEKDPCATLTGRPAATDIGKATAGRKKKMLFGIGISEMAEHPDIFLKSIEARLVTFRNASPDTNVSIALYPSDRDEWKRINTDLSEEFFRTLDNAVSSEETVRILSTEYIPSDADSITKGFDAYYGSSSPFVPAFATQGKPVMIADLTV
ncbi:MAG: LicD family protein [Lachnospiraceae bacterium]|nr:LicD family protein [Lachnospiraceae bacterium]